MRRIANRSLLLVLAAAVWGTAIAEAARAATVSAQLRQGETLTPPGGNSTSDYWPVAVSANTLVVGYSNFDSSNRSAGSGAVYLFSRSSEASGDGWRLAATLVPSDGRPAHPFPYGLAVSGNVVVAGGSDASGNDVVYVFVRPSGGWSGTVHETARLVGPAGTAFGSSVAISGHTIFVSAPNATVDTHKDQGVVLVFDLPSRGWSGQTRSDARLVAPISADDRLGNMASLAASGDEAFVGGYNGTVSVFRRPPEGWHGTVLAGARFRGIGRRGWPRIAADRTTVLVAPSPHPGVTTAIVYIFSRPARGWSANARPSAWFSFSTQHPDYFSMPPDVAVSGRDVAAAQESAGGPYPCTPCSARTFLLREPRHGWAHHHYRLIKPGATFPTNGSWKILALDHDELFGAGIQGVHLYSFNGT